MAKETYGRDSYAAYLGRLIDPADTKQREEEEARKAALQLSDLEAYYRDWVEGHLYHRQDVYTNPLLTEEDRARMKQDDSDDFNRFLNAYLLILQEQGIDVNDPENFMHNLQGNINGLNNRIKELENKNRTQKEQAEYEDLLKQLEQAQSQYDKAQGVWQYVEDARGKGWTPSTVGDSGVDFGAIDQSAEDWAARQEAISLGGLGPGGSLADLWMPPEKEEKPRAWNGGTVNGHYVPAGMYTDEQWEEAITSPYNRVGEDGLTDGQRMMQMQQRAEENRRAQMMASLIDGGASGSSASRNATVGWLSDEYPDINTNVANPNGSGITLTDAGKAYLAELAAKNTSTPTVSTGGASALASLLGGGSSGGGSYSGVRASNVGPTGLTPEETEEMQKNAYLGMLDAMARGRAATGGYTNTAALQAANSVYDAYKDVLPDKNRMASYLRYQGDSGNRAAQPQYNWLNRATNGGYGTTEPTVTQPVTQPTTQGSMGAIPNVSGGTPVTGTPVGTVQGTQQAQGNALSWLSSILSGQRPGAIPQLNVGGQLKTPNVMQAQTDFAQYLNSFLRR